MFKAFEIKVNGRDVTIRTLKDVEDGIKAINKELSVATSKPQFKNLSFSLAKLNDALAEGKNKVKLYGESIKGFSISGETSIRKVSSEVARLKANFESLSNAEKNTKFGKGIANNLREAQDRLNTLRVQQEAILNAPSRRGSTPTQITRAATSAFGAIPGTGIASQLGSSAAGIISGGSFALGAISIAGAVNEYIRLNAEIDDAVSKLQKTGDLTRDQAVSILEELKTLDTRTTIEGLLEIGEELGKLGITINSKTISAVDKLVVALSDEFDGGANEITTTIGKLRNLFDEFRDSDPADAYLKIGNALNVLGATGVATAPVIANFSSRISGVSSGLGLAASEILGVSAALQELGVAPERGASGFNRLLTRISLVPEEIQRVFKITDEQVKAIDPTLNSFADLVNRDIFKATTLFLSQIQKLNLGNSDLQKSLKSVGISGQGVREVVGKLSENLGLLDVRVNTAADSTTNFNSVTKEAEVRNLNLAGQIALLGNNIKETFINSSFSETLAEWLAAINGVTTGFDSLAKETELELQNINYLILAATQVTASTSDRTSALIELKDTYPEYFAALDIANIKDAELLSLQENINTAYVDRIALLRLTGDLRKKQEETAGVQADRTLAQARLQSAVASGIVAFKNENQGENFYTTGDIVKDALRLRSALDKTAGFFKSSESVAITEALKEYSVLTNKLAQSQNNLSQSSKDYASAIQIAGQTTADEVSKNIIPALQQLESNSNALLEYLTEATITKNKRDMSRFSSELRYNAEQAAKLAGSSAVKALEQVSDSSFRSLAKQALDLQRSIAAIQGKSRNLTGIGKPDLPTDDKGTSKATTAAESEFKRAENALEKYYDRVGKIIDDSEQRLEVTRSKADIKSRREAIVREEQRYKDQLDKIGSEYKKLTEAKIDAEKALDEAIEDAKKEIAVKKKAGVSTREADARLSELISDKKKLAEDAAKSEIDFTDKNNKVKEAALIEHRANIFDINRTWDEKDAKALKDAQNALFDALRDNFDDVELAIKDKFNTKAFADEKSYQQQVASLLASGLKGKALLESLDALDKKFEEKDLDNQLKEATELLKNADDALKAALEGNATASADGLPQFYTDDQIRKLLAEKEELEKQLLEIQKKYNEISRQESESKAKKDIELFKKVREEVERLGFDIAQGYFDSRYKIESESIEASADRELERAKEVADSKLELVKGNAVEEERIQKELAIKEEEIKREAFERQKALDVKQAKINAALAILKAFASLDPISASIATIGIAALAAFQIQEIEAQTYAEGGFTKPLKSGKRDRTGRRVAGVVHEDEYVVPDFVKNTQEGASLVSRLESLRISKKSGLSIPYHYAQGGAASGAMAVYLSDSDVARIAEAVKQGSTDGSREGLGLGLGDSNRRAERQKLLDKTLAV